MQKLSYSLLIALCILLSQSVFAQTSSAAKTALFASQPETIVIPENSLEQSFSVEKGEITTIQLAPGFSFTGTVISNEKKYNNLHIVIIRNEDLGSALMQVSRITNPDNSTSYTCRIMSSQASDGYSMKPTSTGNFVLEKFDSRSLLETCDY